jgi:hypothetical protein
VEIGAFDTLKPPYNYVAMIPQWDLLNFLAEVAGREPTFCASVAEPIHPA